MKHSRLKAVLCLCCLAGLTLLAVSCNIKPPDPTYVHATNPREETVTEPGADTVPAMAAAAQVLDMVLVTVLHILTELRRKNLQSKSPLQAHRQQKPLQKAQNTMSRAILWSTRCSDAVR